MRKEEPSLLSMVSYKTRLRLFPNLDLNGGRAMMLFLAFVRGAKRTGLKELLMRVFTVCSDVSLILRFLLTQVISASWTTALWTSLEVCPSVTASFVASEAG